MARKSKDGGGIHIGKRSWWDGSVTTLCGLTLAKSNARRMVFVRESCPACVAARKAGHRL